MMENPKPIPDKDHLDIMWTVATSGSLETGIRPHYGFAQLLYDYLIDKKFPDDYYPRKTSTTQET
jgi:hypothetical protein